MTRLVHCDFCSHRKFFVPERRPLERFLEIRLYSPQEAAPFPGAEKTPVPAECLGRRASASKKHGSLPSEKSFRTARNPPSLPSRVPEMAPSEHGTVKRLPFTPARAGMKGRAPRPTLSAADNDMEQGIHNIHKEKAGPQYEKIDCARKPSSQKSEGDRHTESRNQNRASPDDLKGSARKDKL